jgi:hypothetical protein
MATATQRLIEVQLGQNLARVVATRRRHGASWDAIARHLTAVSGVPVNGESVRRWYGQDGE